MSKKPNWLSRIKDKAWLYARERRISKYRRLAAKGKPLGGKA